VWGGRKKVKKGKQSPGLKASVGAPKQKLNEVGKTAGRGPVNKAFAAQRGCKKGGSVMETGSSTHLKNSKRRSGKKTPKEGTKEVGGSNWGGGPWHWVERDRYTRGPFPAME